MNQHRLHCRTNATCRRIPKPSIAERLSHLAPPSNQDTANRSLYLSLRILQLLMLSVLLFTGAPAPAEEGVDSKRNANTVLLDANGVKNLRIQTVEVEERAFETTIFAIGRIEEIPGNRSVLSSRIAGRAVAVNAFVGDHVKEGDILVNVESRQPGNPPPTVPLKANRSGLIIASHVRIGEPVAPDAELLDISDRSEMWAVAKIPEKVAARVEMGAEARIHVPALGDVPILAKLQRYGIAADRQAGTVEGIFQISNSEGRLQPGMRAEFSIITSRRSDVMAVPRTAIQGDPAARVVYVRDFELPHAFVRVPVQLGEQNDQYIEIIRGLFPGDEVVTRGSYSLGFAGGGTSISLKEALDASHGHEHNDDGSEMTESQKTEESDEHGHGGDATIHRGLVIYSLVVSILLVVFMQRTRTLRNRES